MADRAAPRVLLISEGPADEGLVGALRIGGYEVRVESDVSTACRVLRADWYPIVIADSQAPGTESLALLRAARRGTPGSEVVFRFHALDGSASTMASIRAGAAAVLGGAHGLEAVLEHVSRAANAIEARQAITSEEAARAEAAAGVLRVGRYRAALRPLRAVANAASMADLEALRWTAAGAARDAVGARTAWVIVWEQDGEAVERAGPAWDTPIGFARDVRRARGPLARHDERDSTLVGVPFEVDGVPAGALVTLHDEPHTPGGDDLALLQAIAQQIAVGERNVRASTELASARDGMLAVLVNALALRDAATAAHSQRVAQLAVELALAAGMRAGSGAVRELRTAALLHDIGKIGVDDGILHKPGPLEDGEWNEMRRHPEHGYRMLRGVPGFEGVADLVYSSHEHWDGSGYPRGLSGLDIPRPARIFMLADAWDAMTSERPYRRAMTVADAWAQVEGSAGGQFEPDVVEAFRRVMGSHPLGRGA